MMILTGASGLSGCMPFSAQSATPFPSKALRGGNLSGWETVLGDALFACPGELPVSLADIETIDGANYTELRANIERRAIMAHNITFKKVVDDTALQAVHTCGYSFRIPQVLQEDAKAEFSAQTVEGGLFVWDGHQTRLDYGMAFQWSLNPWDALGDLRMWTGTRWVKVGHIPPDTQWHEVKIVIDYQRQTGTMLIDGTSYSPALSQTQKPEDWGSEIAARLQAEIVSIYPGPSCMQAMHRAEVKDWFWTWDYAGA